MRVAYLDCFSGISGNMVLGALLDAGLEQGRLEAELAKLNLNGYRLVVDRVQRNGLRGIHVEVTVEESPVARHLHHIQEIILGSALDSVVQQRSIAVFERLAQAEAKVHGEPVDHVHFHEVGAMDAIIDIVGSVAGFWLLGIEKVYSSRVHIGRGTVQCAHGELPVPAPATAELLLNVPTYGRDVDAELVTPTGAALLTTLASGYGEAPSMTARSIGYGAGSRILPLPNLLRLTVGESLDGEAGPRHNKGDLVEAILEGMGSDEAARLVKVMLSADEVLEASAATIETGGNRPAQQLRVLVKEGGLPSVTALLFRETGAREVRSIPVHRWQKEV